MDLLIIIVNYCTPRLTLDCLASLQADLHTLPASTKVIVTDNASPDGSGAVIGEAVTERGWSSWCEYRPLPRNGGFAYGNNAALPPPDEMPPYVLFLNPDTVVRPGAIATLLKFMADRPKVGIVGSRLQDPDETPQHSAFTFPSPLAEIEAAARMGLVTRLLRPWMIAPPVSDKAHPCDWVAGACMLMRGEVIRRIGAFDERYFMYFEEVDLCLRTKRAGWECWYEPAARVVHLVGQASGVTDTKRPAKRIPAYWFESRQRYFQKNHGLLYAILADVGWGIGHFIYGIYRRVRGRPNTAPPHLVRDFIAHSLKRRAVS